MSDSEDLKKNWYQTFGEEYRELEDPGQMPVDAPPQYTKSEAERVRNTRMPYREYATDDMPDAPDDGGPPEKHAIMATRDEPEEAPASPSRGITAPLPKPTLAQVFPLPPISPTWTKPKPPPEPPADEMPDPTVPPPDAGPTPELSPGAEARALNREFTSPTTASAGDTPPEAPAPVRPSPSSGGGGGDAPPDDARARSDAANRDSIFARLQEGMNAHFIGRTPDYSEADAYAKKSERIAGEPERLASAQRKSALDAATLAHLNADTARLGRPVPTKAEPKHYNDSLETAKYKHDNPEPEPFAPLPKDVDPNVTAKRQLDVDFAKHRNEHMNDPPVAKPASAAAQMTDDRDIAHQKAKRTTELTKLVNQQNGYAGVLADFEKLAPGSTRGDATNLPNAGQMTAAKLPLANLFSGEKAQNAEILKNQLRRLVALDSSGKVLNPTEISQLDAFLGADWISRPEVFSKAMNILRGGLKRAVFANEANYGKHGNEADKYAVLDDVLASVPQSITSRHPLFQDGAATHQNVTPTARTGGVDPTTTAPPRPAGDQILMRDPETRELGWVPREHAARARADDGLEFTRPEDEPRG